MKTHSIRIDDSIGFYFIVSRTKLLVPDDLAISLEFVVLIDPSFYGIQRVIRSWNELGNPSL